MAFDHRKHLADKQRIISQIETLQQSKPKLPEREVGNIRMTVKLVENPEQEAYPVLEIVDISNSPIVLGQHNYLDIINFIREIFQ